MSGLDEGLNLSRDAKHVNSTAKGLWEQGFLIAKPVGIRPLPAWAAGHAVENSCPFLLVSF